MTHARHSPCPLEAGAPRRTAGAARALAAALAALVLAWSVASPGEARAHAGDLDEFGGHFDDRTHVYHYHKPRWDLSKRTKEFLNWVEPGVIGELTGTVVKVDRPDAIWVQIPYRPAYENLVKTVSAQNRKDQELLVRVWFRFVSPERSALTEGSQYVDWFRKKVLFELDRKLAKQQVTVQFVIEATSGRPYGMVLLGQENVNVWLVLHGWSYPLLAEEKTPHHKSFQEAEQMARREKAGLWGRGG